MKPEPTLEQRLRLLEGQAAAYRVALRAALMMILAGDAELMKAHREQVCEEFEKVFGTHKLTERGHDVVQLGISTLEALFDPG